MFNIKSAFFFLSPSDSLFDQLRNFYVYDTKHLRYPLLYSETIFFVFRFELEVCNIFSFIL